MIEGATIKTKRRYARAFLMFYAVAFLVELLAPIYSFALTTGPSQPEVQSFTPAETTDMVNNFSGDFSYNIPLFELPGPNGGYPFNLAYQSGVTMDQEATWVGLGWSLTPGVVTRNMRGVPDDFNGDVVKTDLDIKKNFTVGVSTSVDFPELWSFDLGKGLSLSLSNSIRYNSYKGFAASNGFGVGVSLGGGSLSGGVGIGISLDSEEGAGFDVNASLGGKVGEGQDGGATKLTGSIGLGVNSRTGLKQMSLGLSASYSQPIRDGGKSGEGNVITKYNKHTADRREDVTSSAQFGGSGNVSFSLPAFSPRIQMPMKGFNISINTKVGFDFGGCYINFGLGGFYSEEKLKFKTKNSKAYGYLNLQNGQGPALEESGTMMDMNREKDGMITRFTPNLAAPQLTYDVFSVVGQGMMEQFRPYRNDIGATFDEFAKSTTTGGGLGVEAGLGFPMHIGISVDINHSESWSGIWHKRNNFDYPYTYKEDNKNYEPVYYRSTGEHTAEETSRMQRIIGDDGAMKLDLIGNRDVPALTNSFSDYKDNPVLQHPATGEYIRDSVERKPRANNIATFKNNQLGNLKEFNLNYYTSVPSTNYKTVGTDTVNRTARNGYTNGMSVAGQIGGICATNTDGMRYVYGIPAYNNKHVECTFSNNPAIADTFCKRTTTIGTQDGDVQYHYTGTDEFRQRTNMPPYAHSYLLTSILGADYVDVNNNGPDDEDFGYWVKFNYVKTSDNFKWRAPYEYNKANYIAGYKSDRYDDKGTYMYGEREMMYLATAETKTHIASFIMSERHDGLDALGELSSGSHAHSYKLDRIDLYSKNEYLNVSDPKPLQTTHFKYNYELCGHVPNNDGVSEVVGGVNINANAGKLTLKSVYFTYENSVRGSLSPYNFTYGKVETSGGTVISNPDYNPLSYDRWGQYSPATSSVEDCKKVIFPYVNQGNSSTDQEDRIEYVTAWNLTDVRLPSGADIHVSYEQKDYAYVQDKTAMQMYKVISMNDTAAFPNNRIYTDNDDRHGEDACERRIFFQLKQPISVSLSPIDIRFELDKYLDENKQLYFKVYAPMRKSSEDFWEYVSGYLDIESININSPNCVDPANTSQYKYAYVVVRRMKKSNQHDVPYHPLTLAILQTLKQSLPQFAYKGGLTMTNPGAQGTDLIIEMFKAMGASIATIKELFTSFYRDRTNALHRWADRVDLDQSYIRLNCPDKKKYGGGLRVKRIEIRDNWSGSGETQSTYGQEYDYTTDERGVSISSGVATYEPAVGGEENALRFAKQYPFKVSVTTESNMFYEYPINESLYPSPSVGYSKVTVRSINTKRIMDGTTTATGYGSSGVTENWFYTAKDYPIISSETTLFPQKDSKSMKYLKLPIPLIGFGSLNWDIMAASQGYLTQLNDMHGKPRKVVNYGLDNTGNITRDPISSVEYFYFDEEKSFLHPGDHRMKKYKVLKNDVPVLINDPDPNDLSRARIETKSIGVDYELFTDQRQSNSYNVGAGLSFNIELCYIIPFPFPWPNINYSENEISTAVTNKVIHRSGILKKIVATDGQSIVTTENKCFDAHTGQPVLTTVTNDFDDDIWKYEIPAHIKYDGLGAAYKNSGVTFTIPSDSFVQTYMGNDTVFTVGHIDIEKTVSGGDELIVTNKNNIRALVDWVGDDVARFVIRKADFSGTFTPPSIYNFSITRSGKRNMLTPKVASIVALKNPTIERDSDICYNFEVFAERNSDIDSCIYSLNYLPMFLDSIISWAKDNPSTDVFIPFSDSFFHTTPTIVAELISKGYIGISVNDKENKIIFKNLYGNDCVWLFYIVTSVTPFDMNERAIKHLSSSLVFPLGSCPSGAPTQFQGATLVGCRSDILMYQSPENCYCSMLFNPLTYDTAFYSDTIITLDSIISTSATAYSDQWNNDFEDARFSGVDSLQRPIILNDVNDYIIGRKGVWRNWLSFAYHTDRRQNPDSVYLRRDGTFEMSMFDWRKPLLKHCDSSWVKVNEVTKYNAYNYDVENLDALNIYSAALYGYKGKLPIAVGANTSYSEFGFEGFEEYNTGQLYNEFSASTGNICLTTQHVTLGGCSVVYNSYNFTAYNFTGGFHKLNIYNYHQPPAITEIDDVLTHYRTGRLSSFFGGPQLPFTDNNSGDIISLTGGMGGGTSGRYLPTNTISYPAYHGLIGIPKCVQVPDIATTISATTITEEKAHSGIKSFKVSDTVSYKQFFLHPEVNKKYEFSAWVSREGADANVSTYEQASSSTSLRIEIYACDDNWNSSVQTQIASIVPKGAMISKWQKMEGSFTLPYADKTNLLIKIYPGVIAGDLAPIYLDDVRIFPSKGNMVSYVYDKDNYRLKATLDNNNYASFFYYGDDGKLFLKKQETEKGIFTVQESKVNIPH